MDHFGDQGNDDDVVDPLTPQPNHPARDLFSALESSPRGGAVPPRRVYGVIEGLDLNSQAFDLHNMGEEEGAGAHRSAEATLPVLSVDPTPQGATSAAEGEATLPVLSVDPTPQGATSAAEGRGPPRNCGPPRFAAVAVGTAGSRWAVDGGGGQEEDDEGFMEGSSMENEGYINGMIRVSLMLMCTENPPEIRQHGLKILQNLFRREVIGIKEYNDCMNRHQEKLFDSLTNLLLTRAAVTLTSKDVSEETSCDLLEEHNILSEAFAFVASWPGLQNNLELLSSILFHLLKMWDQSQWKTNLMHHFCNPNFRMSVQKVVLFFEEQLKMCTSDKSNGIDQTEALNYSSLTMLLPMLLPHLLMLLQYVHSLWTDEVASNIPETLEEAKIIICPAKSCDLMEGTTDEDELLENEIRQWLQSIRETGYNVIGLCAYLDKAFHKLLDSTLISGTLMKDIGSMEFRHLTCLIKYAINPMVTKCPFDLWRKWIDMFLSPLLHYCENTLYSSWCSLLYGDTVKIPDDFDDISVSKEAIEKLKVDSLLTLTREVSDLLAAIASPELNGGIEHEYQCIINKVPISADLKSISSNSLVGYLLYHESFNQSVLRLITYIFGYWTDGEARIVAAEFCRRLIQLAIVTQTDELISFVEDIIIPNVIRCLILPKISACDKRALEALCRDAYSCVQNQGIAKDRYYETSDKIFKDWLEMEKKVACYKNEPVDKLEEYVWIWEIEEEFNGYLPTYIAMLHEAEIFGDSLKDDCFPDSMCELINEFLSQKADSCTDSYLWTMSSMLTRKLSSEHWKRQNEQMFKFYSKLFTFKPYIKCSIQYCCHDKTVQELFEDNSEEWPILARFNKNSAVMIFCRILELWEPQFHPLIREDHEDKLIKMARQLTFGEYIDSLEPFLPDSADFSVHLRSYAQNYIDAKNSRYNRAKQQAKLHWEFDMHLASCALDPYIRQVRISKGDFSRNTYSGILGDQFSDLDHVLLEMSLERRAELLDEEDQLLLYLKHMKIVVINEELRNELQSLIDELEAESFFLVDNDIEWDNEQFLELVDKFNKIVFAGLHLPRYYVIRGIMDLQKIFSKKDKTLEDAFGVVVGGPCCMWMSNRHLFWMDTRCYEHEYYSILRDPMKKVWMKKEE